MHISLIFLLIGFAPSLLAQSAIRWPDDTARAKEMMALYTDALRDQDYTTGLEPFRWLVQQAPALHKSLYINGEKLFRGIVEQTDDPVLKRQYQKEALQLYDLRIHHFGEEGLVLNRKAHTAYRYYRDNASQYADLLELFDQAYVAGSARLASSTLLAYMDVVRLFQSSGGELSDEEVLLRYDRVTGLLRSRGEEEKQVLVDKMLASAIDLDCSLVDKKFGNTFLQDTTNVQQARQVIALGLVYQCKELPVFLVASRTIQRHQPSVGMARTLALLYEARGEPLAAEHYYQEAIQLAEGGLARAELYYQLAIHYQRANRKTDARTAARQALRSDGTYLEAYRLIGDLYYDSYAACRKGKQHTTDRAVFWAAYEMYQRAGRSDLMQQAQQQFPTIDQLFQEGYEEGQTVTVGCWINEAAMVQRRPAEE